MNTNITYASTSLTLYPLPKSSRSRVERQSTSTHHEDAELIRRVSDQDQQAFDTLYVRYAPRVRRYLSTRLRSVELIDEVLQDVMVVLWQHTTRIPPHVPLVAWLCGIARNQALKALTRQKSVETHSELPHELIDATEPESVLLDQEHEQLLQKRLNRLPHHERIALKLHLLQGQSYQEIAQSTGEPESTIRSRVARGCQRLQTLSHAAITGNKLRPGSTKARSWSRA